MLIGMPENLGPDVLHGLDCMGHGDSVALVDRNFPAVSHGQTVCFSYGCGIAPLLESVLRVIPIDYATRQPVTLMAVPGSVGIEPSVWPVYYRLLEQAGYGQDRVCEVERASFYERAQACALIVQTAETERFSNIILQKGIITADHMR